MVNLSESRGDPFDHFFRPIYLGRGERSSPLKAVLRDGNLVLVEEKRGRRLSKTAYDEWYRRRKEAYRRAYKAPRARLKSAERNRALIFEIAEANILKYPKKSHLVSRVHSICLRKHGCPRDRKTISKYVNEFLFISSS